MTFLQPWMLWSFAALLPLAAFYFLKVRPRRRPTTALFLWEKVLEQRRSNSLFRRLRDFWSLLLLMLACSAICFALARPEWTDRRQDLLILIDNSASMAAVEGGRSKMESAQRAAAEIVEGLNGVQRAAVATVAQNVVYRSHLTDNPRELLDAIEEVSVANHPLRLDALPEQADARNRYLRDHRILLISDGCLGEATLPKHIELIKIGEPVENMGIIAADMAYLPNGPNRLALYFQVASSYDAPREVDLVVARIDEHGQEQAAKVIPLDVQPGVNPPETYTIENATAGRWVARLSVDDALDSDDTAYLAAMRPDALRVGVQSEDRYFLEKSVLAFSGSGGLLALATEQPEVVLANGTTPDVTRTLLFHPTGESRWWKDLGETVEVVALRVLVKDHPALRHLDAGGIPFVGARRLTAPHGAQVLVADDRGIPLIYTIREGARTAVVVNMDPVAADFYFSAWFPVLVHSSVTYLAGRENPLSATYRPGDAVPVPGAMDDTVSTWLVSSEDGDAVQESASLDNENPPDGQGQRTEIRGKWLTLDNRLGHSELKNAEGRWTLGSSLLAETETLLDNRKAVGSSEPLSRGRSPVHWLALLAIGVITAESLLYHRRKVG